MTAKLCKGERGDDHAVGCDVIPSSFMTNHFTLGYEVGTRPSDGVHLSNKEMTESSEHEVSKTPLIWDSRDAHEVMTEAVIDFLYRESPKRGVV